MAALNEIIHQPVRLQIMALLSALPPAVQLTFTSLKGTLDLTDGNLGTHLHKLEEAGYVGITKTFVQNKPMTYIEATNVGRQAFEAHRAALQAILDGKLPSQ